MTQLICRVRRTVLAVLLAVVAVLGTGTAAWAHASLVTSTPGNGDVLATAPTSVRIEFSESVSLSAGYLRVLDAAGERVDTGNVSVDGSAVQVSLPSALGDGGYVATYRVLSDDSHPVAGAISFAVGNATPPQIDSNGTRLDGAGDDPVIGVLYPLVRWIGYSGLALLAGAVLLALLDPAMRAVARLRRWAWIGFDGALGATVLGGLLQGPYAAGRGVGSVLDPTLMSATLETEVGRMSAVRLVLLGVLGVLLWEWYDADRDRRPVAWAAAGTVVATAATYAASGHAVSDGLPWLAVLGGTVHLSAAAAWIGGLAVLLLAVLGAAGLSANEQRAVALRFSPVAAALVSVIVVTGVAEAWVRVGSWGALFGTAYGRLLVAKTTLLAVALGAAVLTRRLLRSRSSPLPDDDARQALSRLRRPLVAEAVAGLAAIAVAAVLVATPPARDTYAVARDAQISFDNGYVAQASLDPARKGPNTLHLYVFDRSNALADLDAVTVTVQNAAAQIGPLDVTARNVGTGHFIASGVELPASGGWTVSVTFTEAGFGVVSAEGSIDVG
ncbi:copper resistance CopC/CopD family protein [Cumulibacter manganitolerans]|uniref:copper resistance CopC/CopD family protein n=1 Tax=Cumulibacter manganitolerans TaxID=1884992 RepID=UPI0018863167|nr:copper resistance protein CopC [Cumulibacter manganitolerans]